MSDRVDPDSLAFFVGEGDLLVPQDMARSLWSADQMHGVAVSGALARAAERCVAVLDRTDLRPARFTVDLFSAARMVPSSVSAVVVREGSRLVLVDVELSQDGKPIARASALFLLATESAPGDVWEPVVRPGAPPADLVADDDGAHAPIFASGPDDAPVWSTSFASHQNAQRKLSWNTGLPIVRGEEPSGFQKAASAADGTSMLTNWGDRGIEYINADITLTLARTPRGPGIGLAVVDRVEHDGIAIGTASIFDRDGVLGTTVVTALANTRRVVDFAGVEYDDDGTRRSSAASQP